MEQVEVENLEKTEEKKELTEDDIWLINLYREHNEAP